MSRGKRRRGIRRLAVSLGAVLSILRAAGVAAEEPHSGLRALLDLGYLYGPVDGSLQTPRGGVPGTTSPDRPRLDEIGIDDAHIFDGSFSLGRHASEIIIGAQIIRLAGDATLDEDLTSEGTTFPAGSPVEAKVNLDWYRIGYRHRFPVVGAEDGSWEFLISPRAGFALLDYRYELEGPGSSDADRSFFKGSPQLGADVEWRISPRVAITAGVLASIPIEGTPMIFSAEVVAKWRAVQVRTFALSLLLGAAYERIAYDDRHKQDAANDIDVDLGPLLRAGVEMAF